MKGGGSIAASMVVVLLAVLKLVEVNFWSQDFLSMADSAEFHPNYQTGFQSTLLFIHYFNLPTQE